MKSVFLLISLYFGVLVPSAGLINFLNRKFSADLQARVGPNRAGPAGIFQPIADFLKIIQKEISHFSLSPRETVALWLQAVALYSTLAILPLGSLILMVDSDMGILLAFWAAFVMAFLTLLLGLEQGSVPGWLSAVRLAAQTSAGAFPALLALLCAGMQAGGLRWSQLIAAQGASPFSWTLFANPFECFAFFIFLISGLILFNLPPMDTGVLRLDIVEGYSSSLTGRRLAFLNFGRFYGFFLWSVIATVLFLGGWSIPQGVRQSILENGDERIIILLELGVVLAKSYLLMLTVNLMVRANPRGRVDQVTDFSWKILSPGALLVVMACTVWRLLW